MSREPRLVEVRRNILKQNDVVARELREGFGRAGVFVVSMVSSPGAGKTALERKKIFGRQIVELGSERRLRETEIG